VSSPDKLRENAVGGSSSARWLAATTENPSALRTLMLALPIMVMVAALMLAVFLNAR
jgi:hypothetical protein